MTRAPGEYDVVVAGAGSAGCVVAWSLVRAGYRVALVEAGPDYGPRASGRWPPELLDARERPERHDWGLRAILRPGVRDAEPRAKVVGGCSAHNECAAIWPPPRDFDAWRSAPWRWRALAPLARRLERARGGARFRGRAGPLPTRAADDRQLSPFQAAFLRSARAAGLPRLNDISDPRPIAGAAPFHANERDGVRWNASFAFLDPIRGRDALAILDRTTAERLRIDRDGRAEALRCRRGRETVDLRARVFVLCGGVYGSPALLHRSGVRSPALGRGLQDHPGVALEYRPRSRAAAAVLRRGRPSRGQVMARIASGATREWDVHLVPYQRSRDELLILAFLMQPHSRGRLRFGRGPMPSRIEFAFFQRAARDRDAIVAAVAIARSIAARPPLSDLVEEVAPGTRVRGRKLRRWIDEQVGGYAHAVGTCRMGPRAAGGVVGQNGRVHGLANVYVADASTVPVIPRANMNLPTMLVALRVAENVGAALGRRPRASAPRSVARAPSR